MSTTTRAAALLLGVGLTLAACGGSDEATQADVTLPAGPSATDEELVRNACGDETYRSEHVEYCESVDPVVTGEAEDTGQNLDTNDRGNVEAALGEEIPLPDGGTVVIDAVEQIDLPCPADTEYSTSEPQNGTFVRLDIRAATAPAAAVPADSLSQPSIGSTNFQMIKSDGVTFNTDMGTFPASTCTSQDQMFPSGGLGPGQQFVGSIVLDVPDPAGTLVLFPNGGYVPEPGYEVKLAV